MWMSQRWYNGAGKWGGHSKQRLPLMDNDTDLGGPAVVFPATQCSLIRSTNSPDPAVRKLAHEHLIAAYWKPVYKYIRVKSKFSNEDAKDLTQAFFTWAVEKGF